MKKGKQKKLPPSAFYDYLIDTGMDESVALEIDEYNQKKQRRKKKFDNENKRDKYK